MEIRVKGTAIPCIAQEDIKAGLAVILVQTSKSSPNVTIGARLPATSEEAAKAFYVAQWAATNVKPPIYQTLPPLPFTEGGQEYSLREGAGENLPASVTLRMVDPRLKGAEVIPSGSLMLAYDEGIYTVFSGTFTPSESLVPGAEVEVGYTAPNKGVWAVKSMGTKVATVLEYDSTNLKLTLRTGT